MKSSKKSDRRERRAFSAEFKAEAVRLVTERRAAGGTLAQLSRELDVRADQLRAWVRQAREPVAWRGPCPGRRWNRRIGGFGANSRWRARSKPSQKSGGVLRERVAMRCAVIARHRDEFPVRLTCRVLDVSVSGFYAYLRRPLAWRRVIDDVLMAHVRITFAASGETHGAPRVLQELHAAGLPTSQKRVARLIREAGLRARPRRARRLATTDSTPPEPIAPNRLARQFDVTGVGLDRVWVGDITYLPTREGPLNLAAVLDLGSRRCVGWAMRDTMEVDLVVSALRMACDERHPAPGLLFHSDRGSQYASGAYRAELAGHGMQASMSRKGNCYDNAVAESVFSTLEFELVMRADWHTPEEARTAVFEYLETWYNPKRRHSTLGYLSPSAYEEQLQLAA